MNNYIVNFTRIEGCSSIVPTKIWIISGHLRNYNFTGLEEAIKYCISISATNINAFQNASVIVKTAASGKQFFLFIILKCKCPNLLKWRQLFLSF